MRIAQAIRPDLLARASSVDERIVVRDAVAAVLADGARRRVLAQVGDDAKDLADESVESLRIQAAAVALLARAARRRRRGTSRASPDRRGARRD